MTSIPRELLEEAAKWSPRCVMPESYGPSMYGLAQAICAILDYAGIEDIHE